MLTVDAAKHRPRRWPLRIFVLLLVVGVLSAAAWTGMRWISGRYYVSDSNGKVSIYNGIPQTLGPIRFSHVVEESNVSVNDLSDHNRALLKDTISADNIDEARVVVNRLQTQANLNAHPSPSPSPSSSASPSGSAKPSESHNPSATPTPTPSAEESGNATVPLMPGTEGAATTEGDVGTVTGEGGAHHG